MRDSSGPDSQSPRYLISIICLFLNQFPSYFFLSKTAFTLVFQWGRGEVYGLSNASPEWKRIAFNISSVLTDCLSSWCDKNRLYKEPFH